MRLAVIVVDLDALPKEWHVQQHGDFIAQADPNIGAWSVLKDRFREMSLYDQVPILTIEMLQRISDHISNQRMHRPATPTEPLNGKQ
jgi:hypothetical protein